MSRESLKEKVKSFSDDELHRWIDEGSEANRKIAQRELDRRKEEALEQQETSRHKENIDVQREANKEAKKARLIAWVAIGISVLHLLWDVFINKG